jgi:hypothetical protein
LLRILTNILTGRCDPELSGRWYDWVLLSGIGVRLVLIVGWW